MLNHKASLRCGLITAALLGFVSGCGGLADLGGVLGDGGRGNGDGGASGNLEPGEGAAGQGDASASGPDGGGTTGWADGSLEPSGADADVWPDDAAVAWADAGVWPDDADAPWDDAAVEPTDGGCPHLPLATVAPVHPSGSVIRANFVYVGSDLLVASFGGATMTISPGQTGLRAGVHSGYWFELQTWNGAVLDQRLVRDPTILEVAGPPNDGGFTNMLLPYCDGKSILVDFPNHPQAQKIVFYGSPYGTTLPAAEIARITIIP